MLLLTPARKRILTWALAVSLLPISFLFFIGGPDRLSYDFFRQLWNAGHIVFFASATFLLQINFPFQTKKQTTYYGLAIIAASLIIETIQWKVGRDFSVLDMARNLSGATLVLFLMNKARLTPTFVMIMFITLGWDTVMLCKTGWTDAQMLRRFPVIENFETKLALQRWQGPVEQSTDIVFEGSFAGKVTFPNGAYPGIQISNLPRNWSPYRSLTFHVYNPESQPVKFTLRVHDAIHEFKKTQAYSDRFNRSFLVDQGWTKISVPLSDIQQAPKSRELNLEEVSTIVLFLSNLAKSRTLFFDGIQLNP